MKLPCNYGCIGTLWGDHRSTQSCYNIFVRSVYTVQEENVVAPLTEEILEAGGVHETFIDKLDLRVGVERVIDPMEEVKEVILDEEDPTKVIQVGKNLPSNIQ